jgi:hypothetical protein
MKPILQSMLVADHIYQDRVSAKMIIAGTFTNLYVPKADVQAKVREVEVEGGRLRLDPSVAIGSPMAYISLIEARGETALVLRYVDLLDQSVFFKFDIKFTCDDPLQTTELAIQLPILPVPHPGVYSLELLHGEDWLGSYRITVTEVG